MDIAYLRTLVMLHAGAAPWVFRGNCWYIRNEHAVHEQHETEVYRAQTHPDGCFYWRTEQELIVDYCKFYKLGTFGGNNEVRNIGPARDHVDS